MFDKYNSSQEPARGWNWGAFMFNWIWGIGNGCYLPLLCFVPILNIFWIFVCGAKGNEWAMNSGTFQTVSEFNTTQKTWSKAGLVMFIIYLVIIAFYIISMGTIFSALFSLNKIY